MSRFQRWWELLEDKSGKLLSGKECRDKLKDYHLLAQKFFVATSDTVGRFEISRPKRCNSVYIIRTNPVTRQAFAECTCGRGCDRFELDFEDLFPVCLDRQALDIEIAHALDDVRVSSRKSNTNLIGTTRLGTYEPVVDLNMAVYLMIVANKVDFAQVVGEIFSNHANSVIILSPTCRWFTKEIEDTVEKRLSAIISLNGFVNHDDIKGFFLDRPFESFLPDVVLSQIEKKRDALDTRSVFVERGTKYKTVFAGKERFVDNNAGLRFVHCLLPLSMQNRYFSPREIRKIVTKEEIPRSNSAGEKADKKAVASYKNELRETREELALAIDNNDLGRIEFLIRKKEMLEQHIKEAEGFGGRSRLEQSDEEKHRSWAAMNKKRAVDALMGPNPELGTHIKKYLETGRYVSYRPKKPIDWIT